jgi:hypothetical protein
MTNYLARSMGLGLGQFVGRLITPDEMREAASAIGAFLENEKTPAASTATRCRSTNNNPSSQTALGVQKATVLVRYLGVVEYFLVDFTGGQTVTPASTCRPRPKRPLITLKPRRPAMPAKASTSAATSPSTSPPRAAAAPSIRTKLHVQADTKTSSPKAADGVNLFADAAGRLGGLASTSTAPDSGLDDYFARRGGELLTAAPPVT